MVDHRKRICDIECAVRKGEFCRITFDEFDIRVFLPRFIQQSRGVVETGIVGLSILDHVEEPSVATADIEYIHAGGGVFAEKSEFFPESCP